MWTVRSSLHYLFKDLRIYKYSMQNISRKLLEPKRCIKRPKREMADNTSIVFEPKINLQTPVQDYKKLITEKMESDELVSDDLLQENFQKISAAARDTVWKLLFAEAKPPDAEKQTLVAELLEAYKADCCYYAPWEYNDWIVLVRDAVLKGNFLEFWREHVVKKELGPCWAKDSYFFDDMEDPEPEAFYKHADCVAPFSKEAKEQSSGDEKPTVVVAPVADDSDTSSELSLPMLHGKISFENPTADYNAKIDYLFLNDCDQLVKFEGIFAEARTVIWDLLFKEPALSPENFKKAADLLKDYNFDAGNYSPLDYNVWIVKVRDELFAQKYFEFWKSVIVEEKLGLIWRECSSYFNDDDKAKVEEFYKSGDAPSMKVN